MSLFTKCLRRICSATAGTPAWRKYKPLLVEINRRRSELVAFGDERLRQAALEVGESKAESFAVAAAAAERVLGQRPYDVQILGALAMADGKIAEMQTGEGKTLAATMAVFAEARSGAGLHVFTANDYLARRDAQWMGSLYRFLGLTAGYVSQGMPAAERRRAYACDITYATPNEAGFDYLRDGLALRPEDLVQRPLEAVLVDEADSILIDEARIPLVIAGGDAPPHNVALRMAAVVRVLEPGRDYSLDEHGRNVYLTDAGLSLAEVAARCPNLYAPLNLPLLAALQNALHAEVLLRRDVDYIVKNGRIELVDEFKGRVAENRRWPAGLQTALEAKEGLELQEQGQILGSITVQNLLSLYGKVCGMTGTAATQAQELREVYGLEVVEIPTNRPVIRIDHPDEVFATRAEKKTALVEEIGRVHSTGRPVLVGTASVVESEGLSARLAQAGIPHELLNARDDEREAQIIARAGGLATVTISTNMAGRGTDIPLAGDQVRSVGGLYVIGTNRHESRRIDRQLRGRAGRQGDPGSSRFFISLEDDLLQRYGVAELMTERLGDQAVETVQRLVEEENLEIRRTLWKYEFLIEKQRRLLHAKRRELLLDGARAVHLDRIDRHWAEYLAAIADLRDGLCWHSWGGRDPFPEFLREASRLFENLLREIDEQTEQCDAQASQVQRGATWTYVVNDQPFGNLTDRLIAGVRRRFRELLSSLDPG